jgi:3',5'-cyclic AMP phosphodiesterase CpdA
VRCWAVSDLHVDYAGNLRWVEALSREDYTDDALLLPGDLSADEGLQERVLRGLADRFAAVFFTPGNHDVWVRRGEGIDSLRRHERLLECCAGYGVHTAPARFGPLTVVPLLGWYDFSFGRPSAELRERWADFRHCRWPAGMDVPEVAAFLLGLNPPPERPAGPVVSLSHWLPRIDALPERVDPERYLLTPVLGARALDGRLRAWGSTWHLFGHSHLNARRVHGGVTYVNNAYGYPSEGRFTRKALLPVPMDGGAQSSASPAMASS